MLLGTLGASLLGNILAGKRMNGAGEGFIRAQALWIFNQKQAFLILPNPLSNFEMQKYYQNEPRFNCVYSRDILRDKKNDGAYVINLNEYSNIEIHWIALYALNNNVNYLIVLL